ncbi:MAG: hypothetical protein JSW71_21865 [Gemmatimonadota bacterium]|nr:MAG: hypothetical protein JSW71_21865 [Gemmatimonadota bacterium]
MSFKDLLINLGKLLLGGIAFFLGLEIGSLVASLIGLPAAPMAPGADRSLVRFYSLLTSPLLALALALVARGLAGEFMTRALILSFLCWTVYSVTNELEGWVFATYSTGFLFAVVASSIASLLCGAAVAFLFPPVEKGRGFVAAWRAFFARRRLRSWVWRLLIASVVFAPIYFIFGLLVLPFISDYYQQNIGGLQQPDVTRLFTVLFVRSGLFLLACLPIFIVWQLSVRSLFFRLGSALFILVGFLYLLTAYWLPVSLRLPHALEILADEFVYAGVLVALLARGGASTSQEQPPAQGVRRAV